MCGCYYMFAGGFWFKHFVSIGFQPHSQNHPTLSPGLVSFEANQAEGVSARGSWHLMIVKRVCKCLQRTKVFPHILGVETVINYGLSSQLILPETIKFQSCSLYRKDTLLRCLPACFSLLLARGCHTMRSHQKESPPNTKWIGRGPHPFTSCTCSMASLGGSTEFMFQAGGC